VKQVNVLEWEHLGYRNGDVNSCLTLF